MRKSIFYIVFFLVYLFGGLIYMLGIPYRMNLVSLLVLPLLFRYWVKWGPVFLAYFCLAIIALLSTLINQSPIDQMITFMRTILFSGLIYALVKIFIDNFRTSVSVFQLCIVIGLIQLPVVLFQQTFLFDKLPSSISSQVTFIDFDFGTFNFKSDATLAFFIILIIVFLLFEKKRKFVIKEKYRFPVVIWLTISLFVISSQIARLIVCVVWGIYFLKYARANTLIKVGLAIGIGTSILFFALPDQIKSDFSIIIENQLSIDRQSRLTYFTNRYSTIPAFIMVRLSDTWYGLQSNLRPDEEGYLSGLGQRGGAFSYYADQGISILGDGPGIYFDVLDKTRIRGNSGHLFIFYSETGILGLLVSYLVFYLIAKENRTKLELATWLYLLAVFGMSITVDVLNNISVFLVFCIFVLGGQFLSDPQSSLKLETAQLFDNTRPY